MTLRLSVGSVTDVGRARDHNEDSYLVDTEVGLLAVADGMGGHQAGEVASAMALEALRAAIAGGATVQDAVRSANEIVHGKASDHEEYRGMGTTLTAATFGSDATLDIAHVGDSRAYLVRDGALTQITTDHSLVQELVDAGELSEAEAESDPRRSMITRALGMEPGVVVDAFPVVLQRGDRVLLCSDGLTGMVGDQAVASVLMSTSDPHEAARALVDAANEAGGLDNITVLVVDVVDDNDATAVFDPASMNLVNAAPGSGAAVGAAPPAVPPAVVEPGRPRRVRRVLRILIPTVVVLGLLIGGSWWYAGRGWFVGAHGDRVAIFDGRPGGFLFFDPTLEDDFVGLRLEELRARDRASVREGETFDSLEDAEARVRELARQIENRQRRNRAQDDEGTTNSTTTSTTVIGGGGAPA